MKNIKEIREESQKIASIKNLDGSENPREVSEEILKLFIENDIRELLKKAPNKNALYRALDLNVTYLNLKNFINNKEKHFGNS